MHKVSLACLALALWSTQAPAQSLESLGIAPVAPSGPISTGRPSSSVGAGTVPKGYLQLETGLIYQDGAPDRLTAPLAVLRAGVRENLELRFGWSGVTHYDDTDESSANDVSLGMKATVFDDAGSPWTLGVLAEISLPAGDDRAGSDSADPNVGLLWGYDLSSGSNLFGNLQLGAPEVEDDVRRLDGLATAGVSIPFDDRTSGFVEYVGDFAEGAGPQHRLYTGVLHLLTDNVQVDLNGRIGLNDRAGDYGLGAGLAVRF